MLGTTAEPLQRLGCYRIEEKRPLRCSASGGRGCPYDPCFEDLQDEFGVYLRWRMRLAEVASG